MHEGLQCNVLIPTFKLDLLSSVCRLACLTTQTPSLCTKSSMFTENKSFSGIPLPYLLPPLALTELLLRLATVCPPSLIWLLHAGSEVDVDLDRVLLVVFSEEKAGCQRLGVARE